jgi:hypothetical protein
MPAPHIPNLDAIAIVSDGNARFYAIVGILVSLSAALEQVVFQIFAVGVRLSEENAALIFYKVRSDEARASMADAAIRIHLKGDTAMITEWERLRDRMGPASEPARYRNLVAHNPVKVTPVEGMHFGGISFGGNPPAIVMPVTHSVHQNPVEVQAKTRKALDADFRDIRKQCETLIDLHNDLFDWLTRLP